MWEENQDRSSANGSARLSKSIKVKGEIRGSGDLYIDGEVEGTIELQGNSVTVGPDGRVHADVSARDLSVLGRVQGKVEVSEKAVIRSTGTVEGELRTARISVEDGAVLRATVEVVKPQEKPAQSTKDTKAAPESKHPARQTAAAASSRDAASDRDAELQLTAS